MPTAFGLAKIVRMGERGCTTIYEKRVSRSPKARKKQPHEVPGKNGTRLSKHGVTIHCSHCSKGGHNSAGCNLKKMGMSAEEAKALVATTQATLQR